MKWNQEDYSIKAHLMDRTRKVNDHARRGMIKPLKRTPPTILVRKELDLEY